MNDPYSYSPDVDGFDPNDKMGKDYRFASNLAELIKRRTDEASAIQMVVRAIVKRYGYNPAKYPMWSKDLFWAVATGDYFGNFRRALIAKEDVDVTDESFLLLRT